MRDAHRSVLSFPWNLSSGLDIHCDVSLSVVLCLSFGLHGAHRDLSNYAQDRAETCGHAALSATFKSCLPSEHNAHRDIGRHMNKIENVKQLGVA